MVFKPMVPNPAPEKLVDSLDRENEEIIAKAMKVNRQLQLLHEAEKRALRIDGNPFVRGFKLGMGFGVGAALIFVFSFVCAYITIMLLVG